MNLLKELGREKYSEMAVSHFKDKEAELMAEIVKTEKYLKKIKRELKKTEEVISVFEKMQAGEIK